MTSRRSFLSLFGGAAAAWPMAARAQQAAVPVVGYLYAGSRTLNNGRPGFPKGLREAGFVEGQNVVVEYRFGDGQRDQLGPMAEALVHRGVTVIFAGDNASTVAAKSATRTIPIVFWMGGDPVKLGVVTSLSRPGGNVTGIVSLGSILVGKRMQLLRDMVPDAKVIALLVNPGNPQTGAVVKEAETAARDLQRELHVLNVTSAHDINVAFEALVQRKAGGLLTEGDPLLSRRRKQLLELSRRHALPTIYTSREPVQAGGLMSYSADIPDQYRQAALYVGRILKGEKPGDLPVQQATTTRFVINRKTADALGLKIPPQLEILADEVIE